MPRQAMDFASMGSSLGRQIMDAGNAQESAKTNMGLLLAKQFQAQSAANENNAHADYFRTKGDLDRQRAQYQTPEYASKFAATMAGLNEPQAGQVEEFAKSGSWGMNPAMPDEAKQMTMAPTPKSAPDFYTPELANKYNAGKAAGMLNLGSTADSKADEVAKAFAELMGQGRIDSAIADPSKAAALGQAMAASQGKALFNQGANGVMQLFTGQENLNDVGRSAAEKNKASAALAYAGAGNQTAGASLKRAQIPEVQAKIDLLKSKTGQPVVNPDGSVTMPSGKPIKLSSAAEKELFEADDGIQAGKNVIGILKGALDINKKAYSGYGAKFRADVRSNLPGQSEAADATINLDNMMTGQALESLKSIFGGMPTEGERKILLEMQASADKTPKQREEIIDRAIKSAEKRVIFNTNKAKALRSGSHNIADPQAAGSGDDLINALLTQYGE